MRGILRQSEITMVPLVLQRLLQSLAVMLTVTLVAFAMFRFAGDPVNMMVAEDDSAERRALVREELGLDRSVIVQFGRFLTNISTGELGFSYRLTNPCDN
jgi:peptide/nickel transport system permease protein